MTPINGLRLKDLPYQQLEFVGILLFAVYPSTLIYADKNNIPVIKEWVDCSDDNYIDRYFYYSVSKERLSDFIDGAISHEELINSALESYVFFQDEKSGEAVETTLVSLKLIPKNYIPSSDFVFNRNDGVDTEEIINNFDLNRFGKIKASIPFKVKEISKEKNSETLYVHVQEGKGVGYGTINTDILGNTLISVDKLYKNIALDHLKGKERGEVDLGTKKNQKLSEFTNTEVYGERIAASFGFMLRPVKSYIDLFLKTPSFEIAEKTVNLITRSKNNDGLKDEYLMHSKFTLNSYEKFLDEVYKQQLNIDLSWFNPRNNIEFSASLDYIQANKIMEEIKLLSISENKDIDLTGKFRAIDCTTFHFVFISTNEDKYYGYFDKNTRESISNINFIDVYKITINRTVEKKTGKGEKSKDLITVCYLDSK